MDQQELEEIYYKLKEITAVLWLFSNLNDVDVNKNIAIIANCYLNQMENIIKRIEKNL